MQEQQQQFQAKANNKREEDNYIIIKAIAATPLQHTHKHSLQSQGICACSANEGEKEKMAHCKILFSLETAANHKSEAFVICCQVSDRIRRMKTVKRKGEKEWWPNGHDGEKRFSQTVRQCPD